MEKYGFVYVWYDAYRNMFYLGCHWGTEDDGYICSSTRMRNALRNRPNDFKRRVIQRIYTSRVDLLEAEHKWLQLIKDEEMKIKYYNMSKRHFGHWSSTPNAKSIARRSGDARKGKSLGPCSAEKAKKISDAKKGKPFTQEHKDALKVSRARQTMTEESNKKRSDSMKLAYTEGRKTSKGRPKKINYCLKCGAETPSRRSLYCKEHRYEAMNQTRASLDGSKWQFLAT